MHLTLKFLGDVAAEKTPQVCDTAAEAVAGLEPFDLEIRGVGAFPNAARPRTIWVGTGSGEAQLAKLAERLEKALTELGFAREDRAFHGHLTLGRVRRPSRALAALTPMLQQRADLALGRTAVREFVVFSSQLERGGPIYEALRRVPLGG
jgi:2'-5' RNA ligase